MDRSPIIHLENSALSAAAAAADEAEEAEEALSFSGLVLNADDHGSISQTHPKSPNSQPGVIISSTEPDFFEFSNDFSSEMSHAEDIIFGGKLIPFKQRSHSDRLVLKHHEIDDKSRTFQQRRSESLSERSRSNRSSRRKRDIMRASRSLDYQRLYGSSSMERSSSISSGPKGHANGLKEKSPAKPRWYFYIFGLVQFPSEMGLQDIKNRQVRRNPGTMFASFNAGEKDPLNNPDDRRSSSWNILRVLSCKDDESVAVLEPAFSRLQHV